MAQENRRIQARLDKQEKEKLRTKKSNKPKGDPDSDPDSPDNSDDPDCPRRHGSRSHKQPDKSDAILNSTRFPPPQKFNGKTPRVKDWTREMHRYFDTQNMKRKEEVSFAIMMLTGNAQIWWNALED